MKNKINLDLITKQSENKKGFALIGTLILVFVVSTFGIALLTMTQNEIKNSTLEEASKEAFYIAESGIEHAISKLEEMGTPDFPSPTNPFADIDDGSPAVGEGKYTVEIQSDTAFSYIIRSTGERPWTNSSGKISKTLESKVALQNFAMYAYFSDNELFPASIDASYAGSKIWFYGTDYIGGPLHSNDRLHIAGSPTFEGRATSAWVNPSNPNDVSWEAYDSHTDPNFVTGYQGGVDVIELPQYREISDPTDPDSLQRIAAGSEEFITDPVHSANGVYVPDGGSNNVTNGIWVNGNVNNLTLGTTSPGNSYITITQGTTTITTTTVYTLSAAETIGGTTRSAGTTLIKKQIGAGTPTYTPLSDTFNGVLYVDGNIGNLKSTSSDGGLNGKLTIATNGDITISDNLLYKAKVDDANCFETAEGEDYPDISDSLGLVSEADIKIKSNAPTNIEIDAIIMALGTSFYYEGWKTTMKGDLTVHGSFIQEQRGPVGTFNDWGKASGYTKNYQFDTRMSSDNPNIGQVLPPYFPTTGKYVKLYWKEVD